MTNSYPSSKALRTVTESKRTQIEKTFVAECSNGCDEKSLCYECTTKFKIIRRYCDANIPVDFWFRNMDQFKGSKKLKNLFEEYSTIEKSFRDGASTCIMGKHGIGKTFCSASILKIAVEKGYKALYTNISDMVNVLIYAQPDTKAEVRQELCMVDFLVVDEFDYRFMGTETSADLFGRILESILRVRLQNRMPTILISNSPDPLASLGDNLRESLGSLISGYMKQVTVLDKDHRKEKNV